MTDTTLIAIVVTFVPSFAVVTWAYVRIAQSRVKVAKLEYASEQLQFARQQHTDIMQYRIGSKSEASRTSHN